MDSRNFKVFQFHWLIHYLQPKSAIIVVEGHGEDSIGQHSKKDDESQDPSLLRGKVYSLALTATNSMVGPIGPVGPTMETPHICHKHHNCWLCEGFESRVKFSTGYMRESALSVIFYRVCNLTHGVVFHRPCKFTQRLI